MSGALCRSGSLRSALWMKLGKSSEAELPTRSSAPSAKAICNHFASRLADGADRPITPLPRRTWFVALWTKHTRDQAAAPPSRVVSVAPWGRL